ncbi:MAG: aldo/keto reductase [Lachnospiraceae bacterium]|nr:aldo/keto reductase [Lachnospiraceae bacterium]
MSNTKISPQSVPQRTLYTGAKMPCIGMGTFGSDRFSHEDVAAAVEGAAEVGFRLFDCASVYGNEDKIGESFKRIMDSGIKREELFIQSKVWNDKHKEVVASCKQTLKDLGLDYLDMYYLHWPFPNYHAPGCDGDSRNPDSRPFSLDEFLSTWTQLEQLVDDGLVRHIGTSNMTVPKMEAVLPHLRIQPAANEMELHPSFQQPELFEYCVKHNIQPVAFCPIGSPTRPDRDKTPDDVADIEMPEIVEIAKAHNVHPAVICLKWAVQRGQVPIPFSIYREQYTSNLRCAIEDPLTDNEMKMIASANKNCRLIKGQVFLWPGATDWQDLWDLDGTITK